MHSEPPSQPGRLSKELIEREHRLDALSSIARSAQGIEFKAVLRVDSTWCVISLVGAVFGLSGMTYALVNPTSDAQRALVALLIAGYAVVAYIVLRSLFDVHRDLERIDQQLALYEPVDTDAYEQLQIQLSKRGLHMPSIEMWLHTELLALRSQIISTEHCISSTAKNDMQGSRRSKLKHLADTTPQATSRIETMCTPWPKDSLFLRRTVRRAQN